MEKIDLTPASIRSLLCTAYRQEDPCAFLQAALAPYYVCHEHVLLACGTRILWNRTDRKKTEHPVNFVTRSIEHITTGKVPPELKGERRFIFVSTGLPHIWCTSKLALSTQKHAACNMCAYESPGKPVPYAWFHVETKHRMLCLMEHSRFMPRIRIQYQRYIYEEQAMLPLTLDFFEEKPSIPIELSLGVGDLTNTLHMKGESTETQNFILFLTQGPHRQFVGCFLVSPSVGQTWRYPVVVHTIEEE